MIVKLSINDRTVNSMEIPDDPCPDCARVKAELARAAGQIMELNKRVDAMTIEHKETLADLEQERNRSRARGDG